MKGLCPHGRSIGHVCLKCPSGTAEACLPVSGYDGDVYTVIANEGISFYGEQMNSGLDCDYYDFPESIHCAQDLIEYLGLNFAEGNIVKSFVRQYGPKTKETDPKYEVEKRYFFAKREYERMCNMPNREEARQRLSNGSKA